MYTLTVIHSLNSLLFSVVQALKFNVSFYIVGFVIGTGPLCIFLLSPVLGLFVSETVCYYHNLDILSREYAHFT